MVQVLMSFTEVRQFEEQITDVVFDVRSKHRVTGECEMVIRFLVMFDCLLEITTTVWSRRECTQVHR